MRSYFIWSLIAAAFLCSWMFIACGGGGSGGNGTPPECTDLIDNDSDGWIDSADPDCSAGLPEDGGFGTTQCNDGIDNDGDGDTDADDPQCDNAADDQEAVVAVDPGSYTYERLTLTGLASFVDAAYHPDGSYVLLVDSAGIVHVINTSTSGQTVLDIAPSGEDLIWEDVDFDPSGSFALLAGSTSYASTTQGVIYKFSDAGWRSFGGDPATVLTEYTGLGPPLPESFAAVASPWGSGLPVALGRTDLGAGNYIAYLYELDPAAGGSSYLGAANTSAGCQDVGFVDNGVGGDALVLTCGINGVDVQYYVDGAGFTGVATAGMGNMSYLTSHYGGDYALVIDWSGRRVRRFEDLQFEATSLAFGTLGIYRATFSPNGTRALIYGRAQATPLSAPVIEYRHGSYSCAAPFSDCALTDVSIPDFDQAPWFGSSNTWLLGADWSPVCDGGILVGGETASSMAIGFNLTGGTACW